MRRIVFMGAWVIVGTNLALGGCKDPRALPVSPSVAVDKKLVLPKGLSTKPVRRFPWRWRSKKSSRGRGVILRRGDGASVAQLEDPKAFFASLPDKPRQIASGTGLLVCEINVKSGDFFTKADIVATISLPGVGLVYLRGPDDHPRVFFSLPKPSLKPGKIAIRLMDQDVTARKDIERLEFGFRGTVPFSARSKRGQRITCRWVDGAGVAAQVKGEGKRVGALVSAAMQATPQLSERGYLGYVKSGVGRAWRAVVRLAAFLGWDDPRVRAAVKKFHGAQTRWAQAAERRVAKALASLPAPGKASVVKHGLRLGVEGVKCDHAALLALNAKDHYLVATAATLDTPCFVRLGLTAGKSPEIGGRDAPWTIRSFSAVTSRGFDIEMEIVARLDSSGVSFRDRSLAKGAKGVVIAAPRGDFPIGSHAGESPAKAKGKLVLLRMCEAAKGCLLRLE